VDMRATGRNLFFSYSDRPGALGIVGSVLGNAGINIKAAALTQGKQDDAAVLILRVEREVNDELIADIQDKLGASSLQVNFDA